MDIHNILLNREIYGHYNQSRDRYPRFWGEDTVRLGGLECFVDRLDQSASLRCHSGCVNTVRWNANGTKIVSGSDDCHLGIWKINFQYAGESSLISRFETNHDSNIFHALFVPNTDDDEIISAALDCDIRYNVISRNTSERIGTHDGACHKLDIVNQHVFLSCSEDGTIKLIDMRDKSTRNSTRSTANTHNTIIRLHKFQHSNASTHIKPTSPMATDKDNRTPVSTDTVTISSLPKIGKEKVSCYTMTLNPLNNNILAVGCRDKWARLFDRRTLSLGDGKQAKPYMLLTQHSLLHKQASSRYTDSEGVTGLAWSYDGQELVASYSANNIALFNLYAHQTCAHFTDCSDITKAHQQSAQQTRDLLGRFANPDEEDDDDHKENEEEEEQEDAEDSLNETENQIESNANENDNDEDSKSNPAVEAQPSPQNTNDNAADAEEPVLEDDVVQFIEDSDEDDDDLKQEIEHENVLNNRDRMKHAVSKVKGLMTGIKHKANGYKHNLFSKLSHMHHTSAYQSGYIPYSLQMCNYKGHRTVETVKECNFFGPRSEYVISGSDCRHVFLWRKSDQKIVNVLKGDARITNVVQGNPTNCSLVTSGLDSTVKLFTPTSKILHQPNDVETRQKKWNDIIDQNQRDSERPIPMSLLVYLLRRGLYGFDTDDDEEEEEEEDDDDDMGVNDNDTEEEDEDHDEVDEEDDGNDNTASSCTLSSLPSSSSSTSS